MRGPGKVPSLVRVRTTWASALTWRLERHLLGGSDGRVRGTAAGVVQRLVAVPAWTGDADLAVRVRMACRSPSLPAPDALAAPLADGLLVKVFAFRGATHLMTPGARSRPPGAAGGRADVGTPQLDQPLPALARGVAVPAGRRARCPGPRAAHTRGPGAAGRGAGPVRPPARSALQHRHLSQAVLLAGRRLLRPLPGRPAHAAAARREPGLARHTRPGGSGPASGVRLPVGLRPGGAGPRAPLARRRARRGATAHRALARGAPGRGAAGGGRPGGAAAGPSTPTRWRGHDRPVPCGCCPVWTRGCSAPGPRTRTWSLPRLARP